MTHTVLIVDDSHLQIFALETIIRHKMQFDVLTAGSGQEALQIISQASKYPNVDLVLLDVFLPDMNGLEVLRLMKRQRPNLPIIIITGDGNEDIASSAMKGGAVDYIEKGQSSRRIEQSLLSVIQGVRLQDNVVHSGNNTVFTDIVGESQSLKDMLAMAGKAAVSSIPVLLKGESGVGKEMFAQAIHSSSARAETPFVAVNCGAIPETLAESTLFGHEKGAFTGALGRALGKFREADGGTLFLDEVGELKPDMQVKLLRAIQEGEVEPVGGRPVKVDVRIISATNIDLEEAVEKGTFRQDLYYRLNVIPLVLPPLRERGERDIQQLVSHFIRRVNVSENKHIRGVTPEAMQLLTHYNWPGNVRQLENVIARAIVLSTHSTLGVEDFTQISNALLHEHGGVVEKEEPPQPVSAPTSSQLPLLDATGNVKTLAEVEEQVIRYALSLYNWRTVKVAKHLGISRTTLYRKMQQLGIKEPSPGSDD